MTRKRITARQLNRILRKLGRHVQEDITGGCLNYGGCAVYAALVGRELQRLGVPVGVVVNGYGGANLDEVRLKVTDVGDKGQWNDNGVYFNHVGLEYAINVTLTTVTPSICPARATTRSLIACIPGDSQSTKQRPWRMTR